MKADIHPKNYRLVVFEDLNNQTSFLIKSTAETKETIKYKDGKTYPLVKLHVTSASHPFYTGLEKVIDIEGRVDKFKTRRSVAQASLEKLKAKSLKSLQKTQKNNDKANDEKNKKANLKPEKTIKKSQKTSGKSDLKSDEQKNDTLTATKTNI